MTSTDMTATPKVLSEDARSRVTRWEFPPGTATGFHRHEYDYLVVPISGGDFLIVGHNGQESTMTQVAGETYARPAGVEHDVRNAGGLAVFVEIEFLDKRAADEDRRVTEDK